MNMAYKRQVVYDQVYPYLISVRDSAQAEYNQSGATESVNVRVGYFTDNDDVGLMCGDVSFDTAHFEHCAMSSVAWNNTNSELRVEARDLCKQLEDSIAESEV